MSFVLNGTYDPQPSVTTSSLPAQTNTLLFYQYLTLVFIYAFSVAFLVDLLIRSLFSNRWLMKLSACFLVNIGFCALHALISVSLYLYFFLLLGQPKNGLFTLLFISLTYGIGFGRSMSMALLMVDRILALTLPIQYQQNYSNLVILKSIICLVGSVCYSSTNLYVEWPPNDTTSCDVALCVLARNTGYTNGMQRIGMAICAIVICLIFYKVVRKYESTTSSNRQPFKNMHRLVAFSVTAELILNFLPSTVRAISAFFNLPLWQMVGPFSALPLAIDSILTALVYWLMLKQPKQRIQFVSSGRNGGDQITRA